MKITLQHRITFKGDNKGLATVSVNVGRGLTKELYVTVLIHAVIIPRVALQTAL
jgi:hypothetical protein